MFGSSVLDVVIGTTFVFLLVALGVTAANELIASLLRWRAQSLAAGLRELLHDPEGKALKKLLYEHPLIKSLYRDHKGPSYMPSRLFAIALLDIVAPAEPGKPRTIEAVREGIASLRDRIEQAKKDGDELAPRPVERVLTVLLERAQSEVERREQAVVRLEQYVELWFNGAMDRVTGWYKRRLQVTSLVLASVFVVGMNVDAVRIVRTLSHDGVLRSAVAAQAAKLAEARPAPAAPAAQAGQAGQAAPVAQAAQADQASISAATVKAYVDLEDGVGKLKGLGIPMGWSEEFSEMAAAQAPRDGAWAFRKVFGLLLTTLAALLGAPFWFDILNKVTSVRSATKGSAELPPIGDQASKSADMSSRPTAVAAVEVVTPLSSTTDLVQLQDPRQ